MTEAFEAHGVFWLPGEDNRVPGILEFDPGSGASVRLIGAFRGWRDSGQRSSSDDGSTVVTFSESDLQDAGTYPRVYGEAEGTLWTLDDCFRTGLDTKLGGGIELETIHINQLFKGVLFDPDEAAAGDGAAIGLQHLAHWAVASGLERTISTREGGAPQDGDVWSTVTAKVLPEQSAGFGGSLRLELAQSLSTSGDLVTEGGIKQGFRFRISSPELLALTDLMDHVGDLQDLVSIAMNSAAPFTELKLFHPDLVRVIGDRSVPEPFEFIAKWADDPGETSERVSPTDIVFTLPELGGLAGVVRWLDALRPHRSAIRRVMRTRWSNGVFTSDLLLNRAAALESLDRERTGNKNTKFKGRLKRCAALAGDPFTWLVGDVDDWLETVRLERDAVAHHFAGRLAAGPAQYYLAESAYWLFVMCLMREVQLPDAVRSRLETNGRLNWLHGKLPGTYA